MPGFYFKIPFGHEKLQGLSRNGPQDTAIENPTNVGTKSYWYSVNIAL